MLQKRSLRGQGLYKSKISYFKGRNHRSGSVSINYENSLKYGNMKGRCNVDNVFTYAIAIASEIITDDEHKAQF